MGCESKAVGPHRNRFERNRIIDSGDERGVALDIDGEIEGVVILKNEFRETRGPKSRIGIRLGAQTCDICCQDNLLEGFAIPISDLRKD